jgi:hypothetical protein
VTEEPVVAPAVTEEPVVAPAVTEEPVVAPAVTEEPVVTEALARRESTRRRGRFALGPTCRPSDANEVCPRKGGNEQGTTSGSNPCPSRRADPKGRPVRRFSLISTNRRMRGSVCRTAVSTGQGSSTGGGSPTRDHVNNCMQQGRQFLG